MATTDPFIVSTRRHTRQIAEHWGEIAGIRADAAMLIVEKSLRALIDNGVIVAGDGVPLALPSEAAAA